MGLFSKKKKENSQEEAEVSEEAAPKKGPSRGTSVLDFVMRIVAATSILGSAIAIGTTNQKLPMFTRLIRLKAQFQDLPAFTFFVVSNAIASGYLVLSLLLSVFHIVKPGARVTRAMLIILDMIILAILTAGASAAAAIAYVANRGNVRANWFAICHQYSSFCERASGSLVGSYIGVLVLMLLILLSAVSLSKH